MAHNKVIKTVIVLTFFIVFLWASNNLIYNIKNVDRDGDGLNDSIEASIGSNSFNTDTDDDGLNDFDECFYWMNRSKKEISSDFYNFWSEYWNETFGKVLTYEMLKDNLLPTGDLDNDNLSNICDSDADNDGISDGEEILLNLDPALPEGDSPPGGNNNNDEDGNSGGGGGGGGSSSEQDDLSKTEMYIISIFPEDIYKKDIFYVEGYVISENLSGLYNSTAEIFVNKTKKEEGDFAGRGKLDENGYFNISCNVPDDSEVGSNHIVGHFLGNEENAESWSDPLVNIYSDTKLELDMLDSFELGYPIEVQGKLVDSADKPLYNKNIEIYWGGENIGKTITNQKGEFIFNYSYEKIGSYQITILFEGEAYLNSSNDSKLIYVKDMGTYLEGFFSKNKTKREGKITFEGELFSGKNLPIRNAEIKIYYEEEKIHTVTTSSNGTFIYRFTIPKNTSLGKKNVRFSFPGNKTYGGTDFEGNITVKSDTILSLDELEKEKYERNETLIISGILTDNYNEPLDNVSISLLIDNNITKVYTNKEGKFELRHRIAISSSYGKHSIIAIFEGLNYYLSSEDAINYEIIELGLIDNNILIILIVVISLGIGGVTLPLLKKQQDVKKNKFSLKEIAIQSINKLRNAKDFRKAILECYSDMCEWLGASGLKKDLDKTPREFASDIKKELNVSDECLINLTKIFEKACYSDYEIDIQERDKTIDCLDEILSSLTDKTLTSDSEE